MCDLLEKTCDDFTHLSSLRACSKQILLSITSNSLSKNKQVLGQSVWLDHQTLNTFVPTILNNIITNYPSS